VLSFCWWQEGLVFTLNGSQKLNQGRFANQIATQEFRRDKECSNDEVGDP
jgi:hypothetical protein